MKRYQTTKDWRKEWAGESQYADPIVDSAVEMMKKLERQIERLQRDNFAMTSAMVKIHERMQGPASNQRLMQIAGPARECLNLTKPFLPNAERIHGGAGQPNQPETPTPLDGASC